jgi:hypothetical protein
MATSSKDTRNFIDNSDAKTRESVSDTLHVTLYFRRHYRNNDTALFWELLFFGALLGMVLGFFFMGGANGAYKSSNLLVSWLQPISLAYRQLIMYGVCTFSTSLLLHLVFPPMVFKRALKPWTLYWWIALEVLLVAGFITPGFLLYYHII